MYISNATDYRINLTLMRMLEKEVDQVDNPDRARDFIKTCKRALRQFAHREVGYERKVIKGDYDGYIELVRLPDDLNSVEQATEFFQDFFSYPPICSPYDCTGKPFTQWFKVFTRNNGFYAYHSVGIDV